MLFLGAHEQLAIKHFVPDLLYGPHPPESLSTSKATGGAMTGKA